MTKNDHKADRTKETELKVKPIFVQVDETTRNIIDKYKNLGTTISNLVKDAVETYDEYISMSPDVKAIIDTYIEEEENFVSFLERVHNRNDYIDN